MENHYEAHFKESHAGYFLKLHNFNQNTMEAVINGEVVNVTEDGYVDLAYLENDGYTRSWVSIYSKNSTSPINPSNPTNERSIEIRGAKLDETDEEHKTALYTIDGKQVKLKVGVRYAPQDDGYPFDPVEFKKLGDTRLEASVKDESGQFSGYFVKIENPDKADFELWVDGFQEETDEDGWFSIAGNTQSPLNIELIGNGAPHIGTIYSVNFDTNGGSNIETQYVEEGRKINQPEDPTKDGYEFDWWYEDRDFTEPFDFDTPITGDKILYAHWCEKEPEFKVVYDFNGGKRHGQSQYVTTSVGFVPIISVENFIKWMEVEAPKCHELEAIEINGKRYELGKYYELNKDTTYKYIWKETEHKYSKTTTKATLRKDGNIIEKCEICGKEKSNKSIPYAKTITLSKTSFNYNKKVQKPTITVKDRKGKALKNGTDYSIKYSNKNSKKVGEYYVTITFKGNYTGSKKLTYQIKPNGVSIKKLTKGRKQFKATWGQNTTETTGYEVQYSTNSKFKNGNKIADINKNKTTSRIVTGLKNNKKYYVRIRTYKKVGKNKIYSDWSKAKDVTTKK